MRLESSIFQRGLPILSLKGLGVWGLQDRLTCSASTHTRAGANEKSERFDTVLCGQNPPASLLPFPLPSGATSC